MAREKLRLTDLICKKLFKFLFFVLIFLGSFLFSQKVLAAEFKASPVTDEFEQWRKGGGASSDNSLKNFSFSVSSSSIEHATGFTPSPFRSNGGSVTGDDGESVNEDQDSEISKYSFDASYDLRDLSDVSSVKNQGSCGSCWVFATAGALESNWLTLGESESNVSENNMKECHKFEWTPCDGGNSTMATAYLSLNQGPISEANDPYSQDEENVCLNGLTPMNYVYEAHYFPRDNDIIKQAILDYGALFTSLYMSESPSYYNSTDYTYYYSGSSSANHAVTLVGWDDTKVTAGGIGAWIIKNSWGSSWGENGYFYVSYNDTKINAEVTAWTKKEDHSTNKKIYSHDEIGAIGSLGFGDGDDYTMTRFTATGDQLLTRIASWVPDDGATVSFWIYSDFDGTTPSGLLGSLTGQSVTYAGYYDFPLASTISVNKGDDFYVMAEFNIPSTTYPIPAEYYVSGFMEPSIQSGKNWISGDASGWIAIGAEEGYNYDLGVRVYAERNTGTDPVYRFYVPSRGIHFYSIDPDEKDAIILNLSDYSYEGVGYYSFNTKANDDLFALYRFNIPSRGFHFYTADPDERDAVIASLSDIYHYEGMAYYVYRTAVTGSSPVYRFYMPSRGVHFYTIDQSERDAVIANLSDTYTYEGIAWYALNE